MEMRREVFERRCEVLAAFENSNYLPEPERRNLAGKHGVGRDRIADDLIHLRKSGSLELQGARGCYRWVKPYAPASSAKPPRAATRRKCMCCGKVFASEGIHNRLCTPCRSVPDGLVSFSLMR